MDNERKYIYRGPYTLDQLSYSIQPGMQLLQAYICQHSMYHFSCISQSTKSMLLTTLFGDLAQSLVRRIVFIKSPSNLGDAGAVPQVQAAPAFDVKLKHRLGQ
jgi:hypothetical protein